MGTLDSHGSQGIPGPQGASGEPESQGSAGAGEGDPYPGGRTSSGQFAPGHSGNPRGKPKGAISFRTRLRRTLMADPALMGEILTRMTMDATMDAKVALQLVQWHDGDNPDAFDKEQELKAMEASQRPQDVIGACLAALRQAGMHDEADALQSATQDGQQAE